MSSQTHSIWNPRFMRQIIDSVADGVFIVDTKGLVTFWNPSMEKISGFTAREAMGKPCTLISCTGCSVDDCKSPAEDCPIVKSKRSETIECSLRHKSGYDVPIIKKVAAVEDDEGKFLGVVEAVTDLTELKQANQKVEEANMRLGEMHNIHRIIGKSHEIQKVFASLKAAASSDATILVQGESGTGKELAASAIHYNSERRNRPFVTVNCSALSESLLESELFGHVKGAYTGAVKDRMGRFEEAEGGTIFLDEIGELSQFIQVKLLRVLQEREIERVGDSTKKKVNIRIITATHRDLLSRVIEGKFREDLYYRLKVFPINLPPLRYRKDDIPLLVRTFIDKQVKKTGKEIKDLTPAAMKVLLDYHWPGNIRELENAIEHAFVLCNEILIDKPDLPREILAPQQGARALVPSTTREPSMLYSPHQEDQAIYPPPSSNPQQTRYQVITENPLDFNKQQNYPEIKHVTSTRKRKPKVTKEELLVLLEECNWNKLEVSRRVGVSHTAIWKYMKKWEIPLKPD